MDEKNYPEGIKKICIFIGWYVWKEINFLLVLITGKSLKNTMNQ